MAVAFASPALKQMNQPTGVYAASDISYIVRSWNGTEVVETVNVCEVDYQQSINQYETEIGAMPSGYFFVIDSDVTIYDEELLVSGDSQYPSNLIVRNGCTLTVRRGIHVNAGCIFNIYAEVGETGTINTTGGDQAAGLGGTQGTDGGTINIYGGNINATGSSGASGIGGGLYGAGGTLNIYGGTVTANGGSSGAGIGGGGAANLTGGNGATVRVYGGSVTATGGNNAVGIGAGNNKTTHGTLTLGSNLYVYGNDTASPTSADKQTDYASTRWKYMRVDGDIHEHDWSYEAEGASITATCLNDGCDITSGLTIGLTGDNNYVYNGQDLSSSISLTTGYNETVFANPTINFYKDDVLVDECINVGSYEARLTYEDATAVFAFDINKKDPVINDDFIVPTAKTDLTYTGEEQELINAGSATCGTIEYKVGDEEYSTEIPTATNAGTYNVSYKVFGDDNHNDSQEYSLNVTIAKADVTYTAPTAIANLIYSGEEQSLINLGTVTGGTLSYKLGADGTYQESAPKAIAAGDYEIYYKVTGDANHNDVFEQGPINVSINKADSPYTAPTAIANLIYTGEEQELINAGSTSYGSMLYAVNNNGELPDDSAFSLDIPKGINVNTYYVFYKTSGDDNHNPVNAVIDHVITINIARVDRSEVISLNQNVLDYLETINDESDYTNIASSLEDVRSEVNNAAIIEDNVTSAQINIEIAKLQNALSVTKVDVTEILINKTNPVLYPDSKEAIDNAKDYYENTLNDNERGMVTPSLVALLYENDTNYYAADHVIALINAIPEPNNDNTQEYILAVTNAKNAYNDLLSLNPVAAALLNDDTESLAKLEGLEDDIIAAEVINDIANIGELTYDGGKDDSLHLIVSILIAYNNLTAEQKALVNKANYNDLMNAKETYNKIDHTADLIKAILKESGSESYSSAIDLANDAYSSLSEAEKEIFNTDPDFDYAQTLTDNINAYEVMTLINQIGDVTYNGGQNDSLAAINAAQVAYDALSEEQKALVDAVNHDLLVDKKETYDEVDNIVTLINSIGDVSHGGEDDSKVAIESARIAYDSLSEEQKALIDNYQDTYQSLEDAENVYEAMEAIDAIGKVNHNDDSKDAIERAKQIYDSLSEEQKAKLGDDYLDTLNNAKNKYASYDENNDVVEATLIATVSISAIGGLSILKALISHNKIRFKR